MIRRLIPSRRTAWVLSAGAFTLLGVAGCTKDAKTVEPPKPKYVDLGEKKVPAWLERSVYQYTELRGAEPYVVSGFGLVVNADPIPNAGIKPGSAQYPTAVREYMLREMAKRGVGSVNNVGWEHYSPSAMLDDPRNSIVMVRGAIPPGARRGSSIDVEVAAIPGSVIKSLARGDLFETNLAERGGDYRAPGAAIHIAAKARGQVFVNPALALDASKGSAAQRSTLQTGIVLDGGYVAHDRPLALQLRTPQRSLARQIEWRIDAAFQDPKTAAAQDEGLVLIYVPERFGNDWQHFAGVMTHLFMDGSEAFSVNKARQLVEEARKPDAKLLDISYCWEGLGPAALPIITKLMRDDDQSIAYAAARAAAFIGDYSAQDVLLEIAQTPGHKFQVNAVHVLGEIGATQDVSQKLRQLLDSPDNMVRLEAYRTLARHRDASIITTVVAKDNEKFVLDLVPSSGPPLIYATRTGMPRIALIGAKPSLKMPVVFAALDNRLTISSDANEQFVDIYYRGSEFKEPIRVLSHPDLAQIIARLGGEGPIEDRKLDFGYGDVVGMLQSLADSHKLVASQGGRQVYPTFVLQDVQARPDEIRSAPLLPGQSRPQTDSPGPTSLSQ